MAKRFFLLLLLTFITLVLHAQTARKVLIPVQARQKAGSGSVRAQDLLGVIPGAPTLNFNLVLGGSPVPVSYDPATHGLVVNSRPLNVAFFPSDGQIITAATGDSEPTLSISIAVDNAGSLTGVPANRDLVIRGTVTDSVSHITYTGDLLTGQVTAFGSQPIIELISVFDFRFTVTGGTMASFYTGKDIGVQVISLNDTFTGSFATTFVGSAEGSVGPIDRLAGSDSQPPTLSGVSPSSGTTLTPTLLTTSQLGGSLVLTGTAAEPGSPLPQSGVQSITCNGVSATLDAGVASATTTFSCGVPISAAGPLTVSMVAQDVAGNSASSTLSYFMFAITSVSPASVNLGHTVTVTGGFPSGTPIVALSQQGGGTILATVTSATSSSISFTVPSGAISGPVIVSVGSFSVTSGASLTIVQPTPLFLSMPDQKTVPPNARVTIPAVAYDQNGLPVTYSWTQSQGASVVLQHADSANVTFVSPADDGEIVLSFTISNGTISASQQVTVQVQGFAAELHLQPEAGPGHTSALQTSSTSLLSNYIWGRGATTLQINYAATDGAVLTDNQPQVYLRYSSGMNDVSAMFQYSPTLNQLSLIPASAQDFKTMLLPMAGPLELSVTGTDSVGNNVELYVPVINGGFQINGTATLAAGETPESLAGTPVTLQGIGLGYNAVTTLDANGAFTLDNLPQDKYAVDVVTAGGLLGMGFASFDGSTSTASLAVSLFGSAVTTLNVGKDGKVARLERGKPRRPPAKGTRQARRPASIDSQYPEFGDQSEAADLDYNISLDTTQIDAGIVVQQFLIQGSGQGGNFVLQPTFQVGTSTSQEWVYTHSDHPCSVFDVQNAERNASWLFTVYANGQVLTSRSGSYCGTALSPDFQHFTEWAMKAFVVDDPFPAGAVVRVILSAQAAFGGGSGSNTGATLTGGFNLTSEFSLKSIVPTHADGNKLVDNDAFAEVVFKSTPQDPSNEGKRSFLGIPKASTSTNVTFRKWGLKLEYTPPNAQITSVSVFAEGSSGTSTPATATLTSDPFSSTSGILKLTNVGFGLLPSGNPLWNNKDSNVRLGVRVTAQLPGGPSLTRTIYLSDVAPLYDAGEISGAQRYNAGDPQRVVVAGKESQFIGGDGWATNSTFNFISQKTAGGNPMLVFNDVSREHGGIFNPHGNHKWGKEVDVRYFGPSGPYSYLNAGGEDGGARRNALIRARDGSVADQTAIVAWILANRQQMDSLASDAGTSFILVGNGDGTVNWNTDALFGGLYERDGSGTQRQILNPSSGQPIGPWSTRNNAKIHGHTDHLSHAHIGRTQ